MRTVLLLLVFNIFAMEGKKVDGKIFYQTEEGMVKRAVTLEAVMEEGKKTKWILTYDDKSLEAHRVIVRKRRGQKQVLLFFKKEANLLGAKKTVVFKGTYMRDANKNAIFWGNLYKYSRKKKFFWELLDNEMAFYFLGSYFKQVGGFAFKSGAVWE